MRWGKTAGVVVLTVCLLGSWAYAVQKNEGTSPRWKNRIKEEAKADAPAKGKGLDDLGAKEEAKGVLGRLGFILWYLEQFPDVKQAVAEHLEHQRGFQEQLRTLRLDTLKKLAKTRDPQERETIIQNAKQEATVVLGLIVDEAVRHHRLVAELTEKHKDEIVQKAVENVFLRRKAGTEAGAAQGIGPKGNKPTAPPETKEPGTAEGATPATPAANEVVVVVPAIQ